MRRRRIFLIIFVVLIVILLAGVVGLAMLGRGGGGAEPTVAVEEEGIEPEATEVPTEAVVVVVQPIRQGMRIPPDAVEIRRWRVDELPDDPVYDLNRVVGGFATVNITPPRPISASNVKTVILEGADISLAIPKGQVAYAMPMRLISAVANAVRPGSRVDVLLSFSIIDVDEDTQIKLPLTLSGEEDCLAGCQPVGEQIPRIVTQYIVQNALVLGVGIWEGEKEGVIVLGPAGKVEEEPIIPLGEEGGEGTPEGEQVPPEAVPVKPYLAQVTVVTLAIEPQYALVLKWAVESNSSIDLVMRSASDSEEIWAQPESVTLQYMIDRFQIALPPKLPHAPTNEFKYTLIEEAEVPVSEGE